MQKVTLDFWERLKYMCFSARAKAELSLVEVLPKW
jgi:hypothetical protein